MRPFLLLLLLSVAGTLPAQPASPNGRYYANLPHGEVADGPDYSYYTSAGAVSPTLLLVFPDRAGLDSTATVYVPWILDNLTAQGVLPPVLALFPRTAPASAQADFLRRHAGRGEALRVVQLENRARAADLIADLRQYAGTDAGERVVSGGYTFPGPGDSPTLFRGPTAHFTDLKMQRWDLAAAAGERRVTDMEREQMLIVKEGTLTAVLRDTTYELGPRSVLFVAAGEEATVRAAGPGVSAYRMHYTGPNGGTVPGRGSSFAVVYDSLAFRPHDRGGLRNYFRRSTPYCPYYEMHMTTLNPGIKSHEPHVHAAAETIIIVEGSTEMEIGDTVVRVAAGDAYYTASQVPHAIRNLGDAPCTYFAFQWDN